MIFALDDAVGFSQRLEVSASTIDVFGGLEVEGTTNIPKSRERNTRQVSRSP